MDNGSTKRKAIPRGPRLTKNQNDRKKRKPSTKFVAASPEKDNDVALPLETFGSPQKNSTTLNARQAIHTLLNTSCEDSCQKEQLIASALKDLREANGGGRDEVVLATSSVAATLTPHF